MRIVRGGRSAPDDDRAVTDTLVDSVRETGEAVLRVWQPPEQAAFGRRDAHRSGFERARSIVTDRGVRAVERSTGGHVVYFTGSTLSFVRARAVSEERSGIEDRYEQTIGQVQSALADVGVSAHRGEPPGAFCPGTHSLSARGKLVGLAQRVRQQVAVVAGIVVVEDHGDIADLLEPVYDALEIEFDPGAVGSVARAGGDSSPETVRSALEARLTPPGATARRVHLDDISTLTESS